MMLVVYFFAVLLTERLLNTCTGVFTLEDVRCVTRMTLTFDLAQQLFKGTHVLKQKQRFKHFRDYKVKSPVCAYLVFDFDWFKKLNSVSCVALRLF